MNSQIKRILIVDDSPNDVELTKNALAEGNLLNEIIVAEDGEEALDFLYKRGKFSEEIGLPVVILLDIKMPKLDGIEVLRHIRANDHFKTMPVIMVTSSAEERDLVESYQLGANSYVVKPLDIEQFTEAVKVLGQYWAVINQLPPTRPL